MPIPYLVVFAHARSGSNYLLDLLGAMDGVTTLGEFFNTSPKAQGQNHRDAALAPYGGSSEEFAAAALDDPLATLEFRNAIPDVNLFVLKLLDATLGDDGARRALIDNAVGVVLLRRNIFATWTSRRLVAQSKSWVNTSTDDFSVTFERDDFLRLGAKMTNNMEHIAGLVRASGKPTATLSYSELESFAGPADLWRRLAQSIPGLPTTQPRKGWKPRITRQDSRLPIDRVSNRDETLSELDKLGLSYLLNNNDGDDLHHLLGVFGEVDGGSPVTRGGTSGSRGFFGSVRRSKG